MAKTKRDRSKPPPSGPDAVGRDTVFICKGTSEDDQFVLWLAPRLEAAGYKVFADILTLEPGDRWRKEITNTLQTKAVKMLLCCSDVTLDKTGVQEEIAIAEDLAKELKDDRFIIPLRVQPHKKLFGIAGKQYVDFYQRWAAGLRDLLDTLDTQKVPRSGTTTINPNWELYRKRLSVRVEEAPETLTSNWVPISSMPDALNYVEATGAVDHTLLQRVCEDCPFPAAYFLRGVLTFASASEVEKQLSAVGKFQHRASFDPIQLAERGGEDPKIAAKDARNLISSLLRKAWENFCRDQGLREYLYSTQLAFFVDEKSVALGTRIPWGPLKERRSSMLCNVAQGKVWHYGVSAGPQLWPFPHIRLKSRVVFSDVASPETESTFPDVEAQHRLRRTVCRGWRNRRWHGQLRAFMQLLSGGGEDIHLALSPSTSMRLNALTLTVTSPVTASQLNAAGESEEEADSSTLTGSEN